MPSHAPPLTRADPSVPTTATFPLTSKSGNCCTTALMPALPRGLSDPSRSPSRYLTAVQDDIIVGRDFYSEQGRTLSTNHRNGSSVQITLCSAWSKGTASASLLYTGFTSLMNCPCAPPAAIREWCGSKKLARPALTSAFRTDHEIFSSHRRPG